MPGRGIGKLVDAKLLRKAIVSHIGLNPETQRQMLAGELEVELVPQGTLIERIRAGGYGLGGVLTQTGIGTSVENGKQRIEVEDKRYLLEVALRADFALVQAFLADYMGNLSYALTARNFNPVIAMAADTVIASADHIVPVGVLAPDHVMTPAPVVDYLVAIRERRAWNRRRSSRGGLRGNSRPGMLVNLGIGIPTLVANYLPPGISLFPVGERTGRHRRSSRRRHGAPHADGRRRSPVTALPGASTFDSAMSFGLIRGGHLDLTVLGGLQVDQSGRLANWMIPKKMVPGMGGAMDLVCGAKRVIVAMQHTAKGAPKIVKKCSLPVTAVRPVDLVVTELAVIAFGDGRAILRETGPGISIAEIVAATEAELVSRTKCRKCRLSTKTRAV